MDEQKCTSGTTLDINSVGLLGAGEISMEKIYHIIASMFACHTVSVQASNKSGPLLYTTPISVTISGF